MAAENKTLGLQEIKFVLGIVRKNWWIPLLVVGLAFFAGYIYSYKLNNVYAAEAEVLLHSNDEFNSSGFITDAPSGYYGNSYKTYVDNSNEKRIISSYDMIERALLRLNFDVSYFLVGRLRTEEVFAGVPFRIKVLSLNKELQEQQILFKILDADHYEITYVKGGVPKTAKGKFGEEMVNVDIDIEVKKTANFKVAKLSSFKTLQYVFKVHKLSNLVHQFQNSLVVENPEFTNILQLTLSDPLPERAVIFLDTLAEVYIESTLQTRYEINRNTLYFIDKELAEVTYLLDNIEDTMQDYRQKNKILDLNKEGNQYFDQYFGFDNAKRNLQLQEGALDALKKYIIEDKDSVFLPPSMYVLQGDQFLTQSSEHLYNLQLTRNEQMNVITPKNMGMQNLMRRIDSLKSDMLTYIENAKGAIHEREISIQSQIDTSIVDIVGMPRKERGMNNIRRVQRVNEEIYTYLLQRRASTAIAKGGILPQTKIIGKARSLGIISPDRTKIYYIFCGVGFILSIAIILIRVLFFTRIESYDELKAATSLPIAGEIVFSPTINDLKVVVDYEPKSAIAESFRTIRTNMQYLLGEKQKGVIVITSNNPGEGKTFTSINLAAILAKGDKRVILLELDLHKPRVQKGLGLESSIGVSTYVIGKNTIDQIIMPTQIENLDAILSGPLPPNPSEIIVSQKMRDLIDYCREKYDYVIVDTPPIGLISDAHVLMKMSDVSLFVVNTKVAYRHSLNNAHEIVAMNKTTQFAFILNGVKRKRSKYYYNRYGYGYSYGYGKGEYGSYGSYGGYGSYGSYGKKRDDKK
jgi:capsular exopolysaccharide synthesis family protein